MSENRKDLFRSKLHEIIYESNTIAGKVFDVSLLILILASILIVMLDSVEKWHRAYGDFFVTINISMTGIR